MHISPILGAGVMRFPRFAHYKVTHKLVPGALKALETRILGLLAMGQETSFSGEGSVLFVCYPRANNVISSAMTLHPSPGDFKGAWICGGSDTFFCLAHRSRQPNTTTQTCGLFSYL